MDKNCTGTGYDIDYCREEKRGCVGCDHYKEKPKKCDNCENNQNNFNE